MTYVLLGIAIYSLIGIVIIEYGKYKEDTPWYIKIGRSFVGYVVLLIVLIVPIYGLRDDYPLWNMVFFVFLLGYRNTKNNYYKEDMLEKERDYRLFGFVFKTYLIFYIPFFLVYCFRLLEPAYIILNTIVVLVILYSLFYLQYRLCRSKYQRIGHFLSVFSIFTVLLMALLFGIGKLSIPKYIIYSEENGVRRTTSRFEDFYSTNITMINDGTIGGRVVGYTLDEKYLYYVVESSLEEKPYPQVFHVYDIINNVEVFSYEFTEEMFLEDGFISSEVGRNIMKIENEIYCFLSNGIYIYNNHQFEKISDLKRAEIEVFKLDNEIHILTRDNSLVNRILRVSRNFEEVEVIPIKEDVLYSVSSDMLISREENTYSIYGSEPIISFSNQTGYLRFISTNHMLTKKEFKILFGDEYYITDNVGTKTTIRTHMDYYTYLPINRYEDMFYASDDHGLTMNYKSWFIDNEGKGVYCYQYDFLNYEYSNFRDSNSVISKSIDDKVIYMISTFTYREENKLYFEINQLHRQSETNLEYFNQYTSSMNYYGLLLMLMVADSIFIAKIKRKDDHKETMDRTPK